MCCAPNAVLFKLYLGLYTVVAHFGRYVMFIFKNQLVGFLDVES
jgi:hypothetical protein